MDERSSYYKVYVLISSKFVYIFIFSRLQQNFLKNKIGFNYNLPKFYCWGGQKVMPILFWHVNTEM